MHKSVLIRNIRQVFQNRTAPPKALRGKELADLPVLDNAYILVENGRIARVGPIGEAPGRADLEIDASDQIALPCWCDSHTHIVWAGTREDEFVDRIEGLSYEEIARRGGGILNSAKRLRATPEDALFEQSYARIEEVISMGTGAVEIKSGYGLDYDSELKMLRVIRRIKEKAPIPVRATFLGAHAMPLEYRDDRDGYIRLITDRMLPQIADEGLADFIDVFCEKGFYSLEESKRVIEAGAKAGLRPKIHVNQLSNSGGVQLGVRMDALSVDHLEEMGEEEIRLLGSSETISTLLPSCAFFLDAGYPPARQLIEAGAAVALATDYNPGSTPSGKIPFVLSLACIKLKMLPAEAVNAATVNGAFAMELESESGVITPGYPARFMLLNPGVTLSYLPYAFGGNHIDKVILGGHTYQGSTF